jgi:plasmid stability protein
MPVNLSIKNVPDGLAQVLRERAAAHRRSLQQELMCLLEQSVEQGPGMDPAARADAHQTTHRSRKSLQDIAEKASRLFPQGTADSTPILRQMRDAGLRSKP